MSARLPVALVASLAVLAVPAGARAAAPAPAKQLETRVLVKKFVVRKTGLSALGTAATSVGGNSTQQVVELRAATVSSCQVLTLRLDRLNLALLGLRLDVSAVNLRITGNRSRALGALFCKLSTATKLGSVAKTRAAAASLNRRLSGHPLQMIGFRAALHAQVAAPQGPPSVATTRADPSAPLGPTCPVLDLTLGPLNLDLLGLVVDLYGATPKDPVRVTAVADPAAGILGKALCQISTQAPAA